MVILEILKKARRLAGVCALELPHWLAAMLDSGDRWLLLHNRDERVEIAPEGVGVRCDWKWTSRLYSPTQMPVLGRWLYRRAFARFPLGDRPSLPVSSRCRVSFVIGHRGMERLPHLLATLESIAAQNIGEVECIVVEQSHVVEVGLHLPAWVRYVHTVPPVAEDRYNRSWAFNVGARLAQGDLLILHDNDLVVPSCYAAEHLRFLDQGFDVINLKRFIFYFTEADTRRWFAGDRKFAVNPEFVLQNALGGGSLAIRRSAYLDIGGFDEGFVGWGGEDNELWERVATLRTYPYGHLPLVHLWHPAQPGKRAVDGMGRDTWERSRLRGQIPVADRILELRGLDQGNPMRPANG